MPPPHLWQLFSSAILLFPNDGNNEALSSAPTTDAQNILRLISPHFPIYPSSALLTLTVIRIAILQLIGNSLHPMSISLSPQALTFKVFESPIDCTDVPCSRPQCGTTFAVHFLWTAINYDCATPRQRYGIVLPASRAPDWQYMLARDADQLETQFGCQNSNINKLDFFFMSTTVQWKNTNI